MTRREGLLLCSALLLLFAVAAYSSALTKSPVVDETIHTVSGWMANRHSDYRFDFGNPVLWKSWAALPDGPAALRPDFESPAWKQLTEHRGIEFEFASRTLFQSPGIDGIAEVNRSRAMMLVVAMLLGVLIARWSWRLGGATAAVVAVALFALDPNFLGHAPLVKQDVAVAFLYAAAAYFVWSLGRRTSAASIAGLIAVSAVAPGVKYSALLIFPVAALLLAVRSIARVSWEIFGMALQSRARRLAFSAALLAAMCTGAWLTVWAAYGFRFSAAPDPQVHLNWDELWSAVHDAQVSASTKQIVIGVTSAWSPGLLLRIVEWARVHRLLPEAFLAGFVDTVASATFRSSFLLNTIRQGGVWYYFLLTIAFKTPVATLVAAIAAAWIGTRFYWKGSRSFDATWALLCLAVPPIIFLASSMQVNLNIGHRHVFALYPFLFIACGVTADRAVRRWGRRAVYAIVALAISLGAETVAAAPDFIAYFNFAAGGPRGGISLLADSNLDWGQDLPALADWQAAHPDVHLYLSYFGMVDPAVYGIQYRSLPCNYVFGPPFVERPLEYPAVFAISATHLQGLGIPEAAGDRFAPFLRSTPRDVLGGTIYLYNVIPSAK